MIPLRRTPLGFVHPRAAVRRRRFVLKRSRDSEANAKRNETPCTSPVDSVHNVTTKFSARASISCCQLLLKKYVIAPLLPRMAIMTMPAKMQLILKILEHATPTRAYLRLVRLGSKRSVPVSTVDFTSDVIESESSWGLGIGEYERSLECQSCFVGVEETPMGGGYGRLAHYHGHVVLRV
jgi:hypothetical protein